MSATNITPAELTIHSCLWNNCSGIFVSLSELAAHIATVHIMPLSSANSICKWSSCQCNFQSQFALIQHIYSQHLSTVYNQANYQEMVRSYYPYYVGISIFPSFNLIINFFFIGLLVFER